jgi:hypothetical protein
MIKQGDALSPLLFNVDLEYVIMKVQENQGASTLGHIRSWSMQMILIYWMKT